MNKIEIINTIRENYLRDKSLLYEITDGEENLLNLTSAIITDILDEMSYLKEQNKRVVNEKLNLEERVSELTETIKTLKNQKKYED